MIKGQGEKQIKAANDNKNEYIMLMLILIKINYWLQRKEVFKNIYNKGLNNRKII